MRDEPSAHSFPQSGWGDYCRHQTSNHHAVAVGHMLRNLRRFSTITTSNAAQSGSPCGICISVF